MLVDRTSCKDVFFFKGDKLFKIGGRMKRGWVCPWLHLGLKTDRNIPVPTRSVFYFCPSISVFVGSHFRIYGSRNEVSPSVSEESRFYMELTRIYSVFHPVFNLHKICLKIDMF